MSDSTPLMKQYRAAKAAHEGAILMFRIGDFFEMFEEDAVTAARELGITLTSKPVGKEGRVPLAGVPHHAVEAYVERLARRGYKVALCDQVEDPKTAKGLVRREVTRLVTPGTASAADGEANRFLAAVRPAGDAGAAVAAADVATGEAWWGLAEDLDRARDMLERLRPAEVLYPEGFESLRDACPGAFWNVQPSWTFDPSYGVGHLKRQFRVSTLEAFGLGEESSEAGALGAVVAYLRETQRTGLEHLSTVRRLEDGSTVPLDGATLRNLEILESLSGDASATLLAVVDRTATAPGGRTLRRWLVAPLAEAAAIRARHDRVEALVDRPSLRSTVRAALKAVYDLERLAGRFGRRTANARDALALKASLAAVPAVREAFAPFAPDLAARLDPCDEVRTLVEAAIADDPPVSITDGGMIRPGFSEDLDAVVEGAREAREWIDALQARERERTGIGSLKVGFNKVFGYFIEVTKPNLDRVPADYRRKQTVAGGERFLTDDLKVREAVVLGADERRRVIEHECFCELRDRVAREGPRLRLLAEAVGEADALAALAEVAAEKRWVRPEIVSDGALEIVAGRHPVVEAILGPGKFVPNDCRLTSGASGVGGAGDRLFVVTGPNMAGKSTYIRQVAVLTLLAQAGSFVPADRMRLHPADRILTRIGAGDRLARGMSTFLVEMTETARILREATPRSLVVLDEIGRGTSTYDGLAIAWAVAEAVAGRGARALFATHYHELADLSLPGVANRTAKVRERKGEVVFLYEIVVGSADRSYGIHVAELAGVPEDVIRRSKEVLETLEMGGRPGGNLPLFRP